MTTSTSGAAERLAARLGLSPHPEGGFYRETYRSSLSIPAFGGTRAASTGIYFLLRAGEFSAFHRIRADEMWHFYGGAPLEIVCLSSAGRVDLHLGFDFETGRVPQAVVPAGTWFGSRPEAHPTFDFSLVGCTVAPGFDFADFEMAERAALTKLFPEHAEIVTTLTRA